MAELRFIRARVVFQEIPEEITLAIEVTGCPSRCVGCHSPELRDPNLGELLTDSSLRSLIASQGKYATCVCFMGGDHNMSALDSLMQTVRELGYKVGLYSGSDLLPKFVNIIPDFVKVGHFEAALGGLRSKDTNQKFYKRSGNDWVLSNSLFNEPNMM